MRHLACGTHRKNFRHSVCCIQTAAVAVLKGQPEPRLDLLRLVMEEGGPLLEKLHPDVRTDIEQAARSLARRVAQA